MYLCGCHVKTDVGGRAIIKERPRTIKEEQTVPESLRYLLLKGRTDDARHILEKIAHVNKKQLSPGRFVNDLSMELNEVDTIDGLEEACLLEAHGKLEESHMEIKSETGVLSQVYSLFPVVNQVNTSSMDSIICKCIFLLWTCLAYFRIERWRWELHIRHYAFNCFR